MGDEFQFNYDRSSKTLNCLYKEEDLVSYAQNLLRSNLVVRDPRVKEMCFNVFDKIREINSHHEDEELAARIASRVFEGFATYWEFLLYQHQETLAIKFWTEVLSLVKEWEDYNKPIRIHKGTLYFFLAETYLLVGERDLGFINLYNGIEDDTRLAPYAPDLNYPDCSPGYLTATMRVGSNQMQFLVDDMRTKVQEYINKFNSDFNRSRPLTIADFDTKFLSNKDLKNVVYFFVYNFLYLLVVERSTFPDFFKSQFARLKSLDFIFNLCLIVDETLKRAESNSKATISSKHHISDGIKWICNSRNWMSQNDLEKFWKHGPLGSVENDDPDVVIPKVLAMNITHNGKTVPREIFTLLVAYNLRNYGGHNLGQQNILTTHYTEIIRTLLMSLFLSVEAL